MSRYRWPSPGRSPDRALERAAYEARAQGIVMERMAAGAAALRRAAAAAPAAEAGAGMIEAAPTDAPNLWVPVGPTHVIRGQAGSNPRVAGRVRDLAVSENGQRAYAASASGGVWYTGDAGTTWSPLGNWAPTPGAARALACR